MSIYGHTYEHIISRNSAVVAIVVGNGHNVKSSNLERSRLHFTLAPITLGKLSEFLRRSLMIFIIQRTYQPKRCEYSNKDEDNSPKTLKDKKNPLESSYSPSSSG